MQFLHTPSGLILFGVFVGIFSGIMGLGGGAVMIPIMVLVYGLSQPQAHGTSLAVMVPPVALLGVMKYYAEGNVKVGMAGWIALGVAGGTLIGALIGNALPKDVLRLVFGFILIYVAGYTVFGKQNLARTTALAAVLVAIAMMIWGATRWYDQRNAPPKSAQAASAQ